MKTVRTLPNTSSVKRCVVEAVEGENRKYTYRRQFLEILDVIVNNISDRFSDTPKLKFSNLIHQKKFTIFKTELLVVAMRSPAQGCSSRFDFARLRNELTAAKSDPELYWRRVGFMNTPRSRKCMVSSQQPSGADNTGN
jgi:hypothetical protein